MDWLTPELVLGFVVVLLGFVVSVIAAKYKALASKVKAAVEEWKKAVSPSSPGGKALTKEEKGAIAQKVLEALYEVLRLRFKL